ncbi:hypothetical protein LR69_01245 [Geobacillus sp. BCO2]|nr:hypothetical protein LR69_01245 [Geobacillus sp. BCO2]
MFFSERFYIFLFVGFPALVYLLPFFSMFALGFFDFFKPREKFRLILDRLFEVINVVKKPRITPNANQPSFFNVLIARLTVVSEICSV